MLQTDLQFLKISKIRHDGELDEKFDSVNFVAIVFIRFFPCRLRQNQDIWKVN